MLTWGCRQVKVCGAGAPGGDAGEAEMLSALGDGETKHAGGLAVAVDVVVVVKVAGHFLELEIESGEDWGEGVGLADQQGAVVMIDDGSCLRMAASSAVPRVCGASTSGSGLTSVGQGGASGSAAADMGLVHPPVGSRTSPHLPVWWTSRGGTGPRRGDDLPQVGGPLEDAGLSQEAGDGKRGVAGAVEQDEAVLVEGTGHVGLDCALAPICGLASPGGSADQACVG